MADNPLTWTHFPPPGATERQRQAEVNRQLFLGQHGKAFEDVQAAFEYRHPRGRAYIVANLAGVISKTCADLLLGQPFTVSAGEPDSNADRAVRQMVVDNDLRRKLYEGELSRSWRGDSVLKVRFGKPRDWAETQVIIETVPGDIFYPHLSGDNAQDLTGATLAWVKTKGNTRYLRREIHTPGQIEHTLNILQGDKIGREVPLSTFPEYANMPSVERTRYPGLLVEYVPNWRLDDMFWGISDYADLHGLFDEYNNRLSRLSEILDKHSDPKLVGPDTLLDEKNVAYSHKMGYLGFSDPADAAMMRYLTWDAQLSAAYEELDRVLSNILMVSETGAAILNLDKSGSAETAAALRLRMVRTLAKVGRKRMYLDTALKNILYAAQCIDTSFGVKRYQPQDVSIGWGDGLPVDEKELAEIMATRTGSKPTISQTRAIRRLDGLSDQEIQSELDAIQQDADREAGAYRDPYPGEHLSGAVRDAE